MMTIIKKEVKITTDWRGVLKEINKIGVFGAKKIQSITIKPHHSDLSSKLEFTLVISTLEEHYD